ncbi:hypothetical protein C1H76_1333 [Elsinoe australis]|uniref:Calcium permeable stress-gated cation channel 1 n=1 Tax=Elsinoe australis TaxID=40998 RepID=A0A4U7B974_9PEZI|nr:hypothetical protein C1H76_1333 [Elsinoe australis]
MDASRVVHLASRQESSAPISTDIQTGDPQVDTLLRLLSGGFQQQSTAFLAAVASSLAITAAIIAVFCFLRPLNNVVYAPRAKYADSKHVPPPVAKGPFAWLTPVIKTKEMELVDKLGLDATVFLRFARMMRNMMTALAIIGCGILLPTNIVAGRGMTRSFSGIEFLPRLTPQFLYQSSAFWAYVVVAYLFDGIICYFLWYNYRAIVRLRRNYFDSAEYQQSLASRTLLVSEIPKDLRSNEGITSLTEQTCPAADVPRAAIARNVKELPELVAEHTATVEQLEEVLAKYLKNPNKMPATRPTCKVSKKDAAYKGGKKVDAIEYLSNRIKQLERQIKEVRQSVDTRNAMNYGFASWQNISGAHATAFAARKGGAKNTVMRLAPKPHDFIWQNMTLTRKNRQWKNFVNNLWVALLTVFWIAPNIFSAVFLANLSNLGQLWPAFQRSLDAHSTGWGIFQGIAAPAIQSAFYYFLPHIFRRLSMRAGDQTKTSRERHVLHKLFSFFVFNNLFIYSLFSAIWAYGVAVIGATKRGDNWYDALVEGKLFNLVMLSLISMSTFWLTWLLQRNLGAAIDLAQLVNLAWGSFSRRFLSPTPRQLIRLSAPQPFDYAGYYNYFLFYMTVAMCYAPLQPLVLPVTAFYFWLDSAMKKYLLMYVFITKTESGGRFWRVLFNRVIFNALFGNAIVALVVVAQGNSWAMLGALGPLPFLMLGFKFYCARAFDHQIEYYTTKADNEHNAASKEMKKGTEKVGVRFGHPVLYKPLITPMVHAKAQHMLRQIYSGRTSVEIDDTHTVSGYSDVYMNPMAHNKPGKPAGQADAPFQIVGENEMDFEHWKNQAEFRDAAGGDGELFGRSADMIRRPSEQSTMTEMLYGGAASRPDSRGSHTRSDSVSSDRTKVEGGMQYPAGYHNPGRTGSNLRDHSVGSESGRSEWGTGEDGRSDLLKGAARMGRSPPPGRVPIGSRGPTSRSESRGPHSRDGSQGPLNRWGNGYTDAETPGQEDTSYDYFRGRRS